MYGCQTNYPYDVYVRLNILKKHDTAKARIELGLPSWYLL